MEQAKVLQMRSDVVPAQVALADFARFADAMDLDVDESKMDADELTKFEGLRDTLVTAMQRGNLSIDDAGQPVYTPKSGGDPITFFEPNGASFLAMDTKKKDHDITKMYAVMAAMTRTHEKVFANMPNRDLKICQAIATLFLG